MALKNKPALVQNTPFPNHLATDEEKATDKFGLSVGHAIQYEWFNRSGNSCRFYDQWTHYHSLRLYARGEQPTQQYKDQMAVNGDLSYLNLDWTPVPIIPKFVDIVVNGMRDRMFSPKAFAEDIVSASKRNSYQRVIEKDMEAYEFLKQTEAQFGIDAFNVPKDSIPADEDELQLHMQLKYKPAIEIAEETAISTVLEFNDYESIKDRFNYDIVTLGKGIMKHEYSYNEGIRVKYVDPANTIHSYSEDPHHKDLFYVGEVVQVPVTELRKINPLLTDEDIDRISKMSGAWSDEYTIVRPYTDSLFQKDVVNLLYFNYKTDKSYVYKKKFLDNGGERVIRRDEALPYPEDEDNAPYERIEKEIDTWYEGVLVLGSNELLKWEAATNMVRPESAFQKAFSNYVIMAPRLYKGREESLVQRMRPYADLIQVTHLKLQQVQQKMTPPGVFIDADGMNQIDLGEAGEYNVNKALDLYFATGSVIGRSQTTEGEFNHGRIPIEVLDNNSGQGQIQTLIGLYNHYLSMIRDVTGLNEARDASNPDPNSLVGLQKMAALNSNTCTLHVFEACLFATKYMSECISLRIADVLQYADDREEFANQIGKYNMAILEEIRNLYLHSFGIFIEVSPDAEQKADLENNINIALNRDQITIEDVIDIREVKNLKMANELLKHKRKKNEDKVRQQQLEDQQMQANANMQSQQAAAQAKMTQIQAEAQAKISVKEAETQGRIAELDYEVKAKKELMEIEFGYQMQIKGVETEAMKDRETSKEDRKDERTKIQASQQSKMVSQRKDNTPAINFESNEDTLDGFSLEEFS